MQHPRFVRFFLSALQDSDAFRRAHIERTFSDDRATRDTKLAELDAERERNAPIVGAYLLSAFSIVLPIAAAVWWLVTR